MMIQENMGIKGMVKTPPYVGSFDVQYFTNLVIKFIPGG
jgi:hypothetical protein